MTSQVTKNKDGVILKILKNKVYFDFPHVFHFLLSVEFAPRFAPTPSVIFYIFACIEKHERSLLL